MVHVAAVLAVLLASWLVFVQPFAGRRRYRRLIDRVRRDPSARLEHFRRGIAFEWVGAGIVGLLALLAHSRLPSLWPPGDDSRVAGQIPGLIVILLVVTAVYRFGGRRTRKAVAIQLRPVAALLPRTSSERQAFALLAVSAGVCEELLYRGFGLAALRWLAPGLDNVALIVIAGAAFGLAHLYQGWIGVALTGVLGGYFAWITISTGTLVPAIVFHALIDLRILGLPLDAVPLPASEPGPAQ